MSRKLIIDTNLLLVLVIGGVEGGRHIRNSNRLNGFSTKDYDTVLKVIETYDEVYITPYIATEVSNLIDLKEPAATHAFGIAKILFSEFKQVESTIKDDASGAAFPIYGITDSSLINLVMDYDILTNDARLLTPLFAMQSEHVLPYELVKNAYA